MVDLLERGSQNLPEGVRIISIDLCSWFERLDINALFSRRSRHDQCWLEKYRSAQSFLLWFLRSPVSVWALQLCFRVITLENFTIQGRVLGISAGIGKQLGPAEHICWIENEFLPFPG